MSHDFTMAGSEPVPFELDVVWTDEAAWKRIFGPGASNSLRIRGVAAIHPCPVCGEPIDGGTLQDITVTPGERPGTYDVRGKSVTYTPCGHEAQVPDGDDEPPALEAS